MQPEEYAIQFSDQNKQQIYITERVLSYIYKISFWEFWLKWIR